MPDVADVFHRLRSLMAPYADALDRSVDEGDELSLTTAHRMKNGSNLGFGGVTIGKRYVTYHLMPVYVEPALLDGNSPELRARMQGKSCFNFTRADEALFAELAALTEAGFEAYRGKGYV